MLKRNIPFGNIEKIYTVKIAYSDMHFQNRFVDYDYFTYDVFSAILYFNIADALHAMEYVRRSADARGMIRYKVSHDPENVLSLYEDGIVVRQVNREYMSKVIGLERLKSIV